MDGQQRQHGSNAKRIVRQLDSRLDGHVPSNDAFVVSVYGEWGIGKTRCLQEIYEIYSARLKDVLGAAATSPAERLVVPVFFDPWQYEHEDHLVIPLLKTIEHALLGAADALEARAKAGQSRTQVLVDNVLSATKKATSVLADVTVALAKAFRLKFSPLKEVTGFEIEFAPDRAFESAEKDDERAKSAKAAKPQSRKTPLPDAARLESLYFSVRASLEKITASSNPELRLVILIDDLDRCLPEKAIQVLESVKLFLNVRGFSFVMAVDDEVVERGIAHRYKDYLASSAGEGGGMAPISGAEYLEKIVHLPVHLQRWTKDEARTFLAQSYPRIFCREQPAPEAKQGRGFGRQAEHAGSPDRAEEQPRKEGLAPRVEDTALLDLVVDSIPLVPRKLIRLAEALEYQLDHFHDIGMSRHWNVRHALRIAVLQQLYPALYRHVRARTAIRYWRLFRLRVNQFGEPSIDHDKSPNHGKSLPAILDEFKLDRRDRPKQGPPGTSQITETRHEQLVEWRDLMQLVERSAKQRGNPEPLGLFTGQPDHEPELSGMSLNETEFERLFFHGLEVREAPRSITTELGEDLPIAQVKDAERLVAVLVTGDTAARREYVQQEGISGRLPTEAFTLLQQQLRRDSAPVLDVQWLSDVSTLLSTQQLLELYETHDVLGRLARGLAKETRHAR